MKIPRNGKSVDISSEAVAARVFYLRTATLEEDMSDHIRSADMLEAIASDRDRLHAFVRSARGIIDRVARYYPKRWVDREQDPFGSREWLQAESTEIGTARDGVDPKVK